MALPGTTSTATAASTSDRLLQLERVSIAFPRLDGLLLAANAVSFHLKRGETLGLVGESGCGKSVTLRSILGLVPTPGEVIEGSIRWNGRDLLALRSDELVAIRGREISMISQDPTAALNPVLTVGDQIAEVLRVKRAMSKRDARERVKELLARVGIPAPANRARDYPHQLSGGMRQRVMIAMAIACEPALLLADEPTTALDVTIQDQILELIMELQQETGMSIIIVSHDLGVIAETCDAVAVMYAGFLVEYGTREQIVCTPRHPYTRALLAGVPTVSDGSRKRFEAIPGVPPDLGSLPPGCPFQARCPHAGSRCATIPMTLDQPIPAHGSACPVVQ